MRFSVLRMGYLILRLRLGYCFSLVVDYSYEDTNDFNGLCSSSQAILKSSSVRGHFVTLIEVYMHRITCSAAHVCVQPEHRTRF